jgi:preprotein translocase subunit SecD
MYNPRHKAPVNTFPLWKYFLILIIAVLAILYTLPNIFGDTPSLQLSPKNGTTLNSTLLSEITSKLSVEKIPFKVAKKEDFLLQLKFPNVVDQMKAKTLLSDSFGQKLTTALMLAPNTPQWLQKLGANPMNLGLDLRGGMHFVLEADVNVAVKNNLNNYAQEMRTKLRVKDVRYSGIEVLGDNIVISFRKNNTLILSEAKNLVSGAYPSLTLTSERADKNQNGVHLFYSLKKEALTSIENNSVDQVVQVMRNRVNELGVAEASVSKAGGNRVIIELPGLQDAARAKQILGGTATVNFQLVNEKADIQSAVSGNVPIGSSLYYTGSGAPLVLYNRVILSGDAVVDAKLGYDQQSQLPVVQVKLSGPQVSYFSKTTAKNIGNLLATVLVQTTFDTKIIDGKKISTPRISKRVISYANIQSQLGNNFQITGLTEHEAQNLSLLIKSGALPTPVQIVQEQQIGPTMGAENIKMGAISIVVALILVVLFMLVYYRFFGFIANIALLLNFFMIIGIMSIMPGATLTLPGIAGIVLNLGMAIDANVLIFERIREEIRNGMPIQSAIHAGYERAFATIVDSNLTTLIVAVILFAIGTGPVKGFAVTLMIGIVTSMYTSVTVSRGITNLVYGKKRNLKKISIGI